MHKTGAWDIANSATEEAQCKAENEHIGEIEGRLEQTVHPAKRMDKN
jgi:hypothetical protein